MDIDLMLTTVGDNDPSCNPCTLTEADTVKFSDWRIEQQGKELLNQHTVKLRDTWPCNRSKATLIPLDGHLAVLRDPDMFGGRRRRSSCAGPGLRRAAQSARDRCCCRAALRGTGPSSA